MDTGHHMAATNYCATNINVKQGFQIFKATPPTGYKMYPKVAQFPFFICNPKVVRNQQLSNDKIYTFSIPDFF